MDQALDTDTRAVIALLQDAVTDSGLSYAAFARALGTSPSRLSTYMTGATRPSAQFCMRAQRLARSLAAGKNDGLLSAPATAAAIRRHLRVGEREWAWRMLLQGRDHLRLMLTSGDEHLYGSWEARPGQTGSGGFDALLAAITRHEFEAAGTTAPEWACIEPLSEPWVPEHPFLSPNRVVAKTPDWLRRLNIFVPERDLITA